MPIVSLIARQECLDSQLATALHKTVGGTPLKWLSPGEAAEFEAPRIPTDFKALRKDLRRQGVDLNILPDTGRRKRLLLADMDSTMIEQECIDELAAKVGVGEEVAQITLKAMNGDLEFDGALRQRVALLRGMPAEVIASVLAERITLTPGGLTLVTTMRRAGAHAALVSGGFTAFSGEIAKRLRFDSHRANRLEIEDGILTGRVLDPILGREAKVERLDELCWKLKIDRKQVLAVGDGANDLGMIKAAGMGVALHAKKKVAKKSPLRIGNGDLTALLFLQGYARDEFRSRL